MSSPTAIKNFFAHIAPRYDVVNDVLSLFLCRYWNRALLKAAMTHGKVSSYLDLCAGTGTLAKRLIKSLHPDRSVLLDFCPEMLAVAQRRLVGVDGAISYVVADACASGLEAVSVDIITCAYGIRNVADVSGCLREAHRVLRPGGMLAIVELTRPQSRILSFLHGLYLRWVMPWVGGLVTFDFKAYKHLRDSVEAFMPPSALLAELRQNGFREVKAVPLSGGIATLFVAKK